MTHPFRPAQESTPKPYQLSLVYLLRYLVESHGYDCRLASELDRRSTKPHQSSSCYGQQHSQN